jgi:AcrR family transcriptional regulator
MSRKPTLKPRKQPLQERSRATVDIILTAATQVLERTGLEEMTTNQIAERAGVSVASVYQYFPNKEAITAALMGQHLQKQAALFGAVLADHHKQSFEALSGALLDLVMNIFLDNEPLVRQMLRYGAQLEGQQQLRAIRDFVAMRLVEELLRRRPTWPLRQAQRSVFTGMHAAIGLMYGYLSTNTHAITANELREDMQRLMRGWWMAEL